LNNNLKVDFEKLLLESQLEDLIMATRKTSAKRSISRSVSRRKSQTKFVKTKLTQVNKILEKLELEVQKTLKKFRKNSEKSSKLLRENFDEIIERIGVADFYTIASEKTEEIRFELKRLTDDIVDRVKGFDLSTASPLTSEIRSSFEQVIDKVQSLEWVEIAKDTAVNTRKQFLNVFSLPSRDDVAQLNRKVIYLEKKVKTLSKRKKAA